MQSKLQVRKLDVLSQTFSAATETMIHSGNALLSFERTQQSGHSSLLWSRTVVGRHCFSISKFSGAPSPETPAQLWLESLATAKTEKRVFSAEAPLSPRGEAVDDPFIDELLNRPNSRSNRPSSPGAFSQHSGLSTSSQDVGDMLQIVRQSKRKPSGLPVSLRRWAFIIFESFPAHTPNRKPRRRNQKRRTNRSNFSLGMAAICL
jgi:hypothetical protein